MSFLDAWYQKFLKRFAFYIVFIGIIGVLAYALFVELSSEAPGDNAPFKDMITTEEIVNQTIGDNLAKPHRADSEIQAWLVRVISETINFDQNSFAQALTDNRQYFAPSGLQTLRRYMQGANFRSYLSNGAKISLLVKEQPLLMNYLVQQGVYKWLYEMPVSINVVYPTARLLSSRNDQIVKNYVLRVQIRRSLPSANNDEMQIESWQMIARNR